MNLNQTDGWCNGYIPQLSYPEEWVDVDTWEGRYYLSSAGRVYTAVNQRLMKPTEVNGYFRVCFRSPGRKETPTIHLMVAKHFINNPNNYPIVLHGDKNNTKNNSVDNLRWGTHQENMDDKNADGHNWHLNQTHCRRGHEYAGNNLIIIKNDKTKTGKSRECKACLAAKEHLRTYPEKDFQEMSDLYYERILKGLPTIYQCHRGHLLEDFNIVDNKYGKRICLSCSTTRGRLRSNSVTLDFQTISNIIFDCLKNGWEIPDFKNKKLEDLMEVV